MQFNHDLQEHFSNTRCCKIGSQGCNDDDEGKLDMVEVEPYLPDVNELVRGAEEDKPKLTFSSSRRARETTRNKDCGF